MPTVAEINSNLIAQLQTELNQTIPLLPRSFLRVLSKAIAGVFILTYKYAGFTALQQFVRTADIQQSTFNGITVSPLIEWGRLIGVGDPTPATRAELTVTVTSTGSGTIPAFSQLLGGSNGVVYLTTQAVDVVAGTSSLRIRASSDQQGGNGSGTIGNLDAVARVSFVAPIPAVNTDTVVVRQDVTGADSEATEIYRQRVVRRFQRRPQGGALIDYQIWGEEVAGVINVYPYTGDPGQVNVYVEVNNQPQGIPAQAQLDAVERSINLDMDGRATRRPANALVNTLAIRRTVFARARARSGSRQPERHTYADRDSPAAVFRAPGAVHNWRVCCASSGPDHCDQCGWRCRGCRHRKQRNFYLCGGPRRLNRDYDQDAGRG